MPDDFKAILVTAFIDNVTHMSLHTTPGPGTTGANDSAVTHVELTWGSIVDGVSSALAEFADVTGDYTHIGLWEGATFRQGIACEIHYTAPANLAILVTHEVGDEVDE
jgi:hypothetical protein